MSKKYEFTGETKRVWGVTLHRIRALVDIPALRVSVGDLGGWVESESNLSQGSDNAWVFSNALVSGNARAYGNARVYSNTQVFGDARVYAPVITATRSDGYTFLIAPTPEGPRIIAGCRYFSLEQARKHWANTRGGTRLGQESLALVDHLERMAILNGFMEPVVEEPQQ